MNSLSFLLKLRLFSMELKIFKIHVEAAEFNCHFFKFYPDILDWN